MNGVLVEKQAGTQSRLRFALDPVAEFLAAAWYADECEIDNGQLEAILAESETSLGFQVALKLVRKSHGPSENGRYQRQSE